jgi:prophage regulatory protein
VSRDSEKRFRRGDIRLMGASEIALRLGITRQRVYQITVRFDFPRPLVTLAMGSVWLADDVEMWIREHRPHLDETDDA